MTKQSSLSRRGLLAGIAALGAAAIAKVTGGPRAEASHSTNDGLLHFAGSSTNMPTARAYAQLSNVGDTEFVIGVDGFAASSTVHAYGLRGGISNSGGGRGAGIMGSAFSASNNQAAGVYGFADTVSLNVHPNRAAAVGVHGLSNNRIGVRGDSRQAVGVFGVSGPNAETLAMPTGLLGVAGLTVDGKGVYGRSTTSDGVHGTSTSGVGLRGTSSGFVGLVGISDSSIGLYGYTVAANMPAFYAEHLGQTGRIAARFYGDVQVEGNFTVTGGAKNAAVPMPDGSLAVVYCQESPEPYFEDFGRGRMVNGQARVQIESEFASTIKQDDYMVFFTPEGELKNPLYVAQKNANGFEVREANGGKSDLPFTYRIVGRRRDIPGKRLERVDPKVKQNIAAMRGRAAARQQQPQQQRSLNPQAGQPIETPLVPMEP